MYLTIYEVYYNQILKFNLLTKYNYKNYYELPKLKKIILTSKSTKFLDLLSILTIFIFFELLTTQRPYLIFLKKIKLHGTIKNGTLIGCKLTLQKNLLYRFISIFTLKIFPQTDLKIKSNSKLIKKNINTYSININELTLIPHYEKFYYLFNKLTNLSITYISTKFIIYPLFLTLLYLPFQLTNINKKQKKEK